MNSDFSDFIRFFPIFRLFPTFRLLDSTTLVSTLLIFINFFFASVGIPLPGLAGLGIGFGAIVILSLLVFLIRPCVSANLCHATDLTVPGTDTSNSSCIKRILLGIKLSVQWYFHACVTFAVAFQLQGSKVSEMNNGHHHHY